MAKNLNKKVSITAFEKVMKENAVSVTEVDWLGEKIAVKRTISMTEMLEMVNFVVDSCFQDGYGYMPEMKDFATSCSVLTHYGNFTMPDNIEKAYEMVYSEVGRAAIEAILRVADGKQFRSIMDAIDEKIQNRCDSYVSEIQKRADETVEALEKLADSVGALFAGVDAGDIEKLTKALGETGKLDEEKIVKALTGKKPAKKRAATKT